MKTNQQSKDNNGIPRILALKLAFGDDFIDYIKDEVGVEKFLEDGLFEEENKKRNFLLEDSRVADFLKKWTIFVQKYKNLYGKNVRDVDAISNLIKEGILSNDSLYKFRNKIFKTDFYLDEDFIFELSNHIKFLEEADSKILLGISQKHKKLINDRIW